MVVLPEGTHVLSTATHKDNKVQPILPQGKRRCGNGSPAVGFVLSVTIAAIHHHKKCLQHISCIDKRIQGRDDILCSELLLGFNSFWAIRRSRG